MFKPKVFSGAKCTVLKKVFVTLLGVSVPQVIRFRARDIVPPFPPSVHSCVYAFNVLKTKETLVAVMVMIFSSPKHTSYVSDHTRIKSKKNFEMLSSSAFNGISSTKAL